MMLFNEYRKSNAENFCNLLSVMEGYPADQEVKGGYTPIRIKLLIITCPRPPVAMIVNGISYPGEYESQDKYGQDHAKVAWEDVAQVMERIRESGGKLVCFEKHDVAGVRTYI